MSPTTHGELRVQNWMLGACLSIVLLILGKLFTVAEGVSKMSPRVEGLEVTVSTLYRASDARRDSAETSARMTALEQRIARLEQRIERRPQP